MAAAAGPVERIAPGALAGRPVLPDYPAPLVTLEPRRRLPSRSEIPWTELRRHAREIYGYLARGWSALAQAERLELSELLRKSRGRPRNLTRDEARRLGQLVARAASAAAARNRRR